MSLNREAELSYDRDIEKVTGIQFGVMGGKEILERSVVPIFKSDAINNNMPVANGLYDSRMGVIEMGQVCPTCHQKNTFCPGHFGHIQLHKPVFSIQFFNMTRRLLRCVCVRCSKLLVNPESDEVKAILNKKYSRQRRWDLMYKILNKKKRCGQDTSDGCGTKIPKITRENMLRIGLEWKDDSSTKMNQVVNKQVLNAEDVLAIFRRISDRDAEILGFSPKFNRPEWMICTVFPVPPPSVRPSVRNDTGMRQEDDLTHKLSEIVKHNNMLGKELEKKTEKNSVKEQNLLMLLQWSVATMIDNTTPSLAPAKQMRTNRNMRSIIERLKSKEGRIRGNLMGKRVDFSSRSVITPDPNIRMDQLGVPYKIAMNLTFPEIVNAYNIDTLQELVNNGPDIYPGAKSVRRKNGATYRLKSRSDKVTVLEIGDVVDRHLQNDDVCLFNRQPSLHRMSMMAHYIVVMPYNTFRMNVTVTPCYNADFDGDECNMHIPQSYQTREELQQLTAVSTQVISPRESKPIISVVQDISTGLYRLTKPEVRITQKQLFNLMALNPKVGLRIPKPMFVDGKVKKWSGHQLLSTIMPEKVNMDLKTKNYDDQKSKEDNINAIVKIRNGEITSGAFHKEVYQKQSAGIVHQVFNEYGPEETTRLFDNTQQLICNWLAYDGFSVGVSDLVVEDKNTLQLFKKTIEKMKAEANENIYALHKGTIENNTIMTNQEKFEKDINKVLNSAVNEIGKAGLSQIDEKTNRMINIIKSGSKGSTTNIAQMVGCLGQQNVDGKRIPYGFDNRTLPHYTKFDDGPEARGFVDSSFISGLTPQEFFFHAMGGREGLINTAVSTSDSGYIQRKLIKAMEDCKVNYDGTVRNAGGNIIQFLYGEDGMDSTKIELQKIPTVAQTQAEVIQNATFTENLDELKDYLEDDIRQKRAKDKEFHDNMSQHVFALLEDREFVITKMFRGEKETSVHYAVHFDRILNINASMQNKFGPPPSTDLDPAYVLQRLDEVTKLEVTKHQKANKLLGILARYYLSPKRILLERRMLRGTFDMAIEQIKHRFYTSLVNPSEMVGVIAAQSIGEPSTQLTLDSFHYAGVSAMAKSVMGVPRLKELLDMTKEIREPDMRIVLKDSVSSDNGLCTQIKNDITIVHFKDIVKSLRVYFDPDDFNTTIPEDQAMIDLYREFNLNPQGTSLPSLSPWLLRLEFNKEKVDEYNLDMIKIYHSLDRFYEDRIFVLNSDDNADELVMRIKLTLDADKSSHSDDVLTELRALEFHIMENFEIKGIPNIERVDLDEMKVSLWDPVKKEFQVPEKPKEGEKQKRTRWCLVSAGCNMMEVMGMDVVDPYNVTSNDINEIYNILGVEAARVALYNEIIAVLAQNHVNYRHLALLIDVMTNKGNILSVNRHGINRGDIGPLAKCSFEETTDKLVKAAVFAEYDKINGVAASIMLGQIAPAGTGDFDVFLDDTLLPKKTRAEVLAGIPEADEEETTEADEKCIEQTFNVNMDFPVRRNPDAHPENFVRKANTGVTIV